MAIAEKSVELRSSLSAQDVTKFTVAGSESRKKMFEADRGLLVSHEFCYFLKHGGLQSGASHIRVQKFDIWKVPQLYRTTFRFEYSLA